MELFRCILGNLGGVDVNKRTRALDEETYIKIISAIKQGFLHEGVRHKPNVRVATILVLEYNFGLRISDILLLTVNSFVKDGDRYRLDLYEKKTGKYRNFTVPAEIYQYVRDYAYQNGIGIGTAELEKAISKNVHLL